MRAAEILAANAHRPWPLPRRPWVMRQTWTDLLFAHWPLPPAALAGKLPPGLALDTYEGQAWVGVVPFVMRDVYPRGTMSLPYVSKLFENNVRTYVTVGSKPGVYFFSLDASSPLAVALARMFFFLPYYPAFFRFTRRGDAVTYTSSRWHHGTATAAFDATYRPTGPVYHTRPGSLAHFLTERYCLYSVGPRGRLYRGNIHHLPWPLQPAEAEIRRNTMAQAAGIALPETPPLLHFARRVEMLAWPVTRVGVSSA